MRIKDMNPKLRKRKIQTWFRAGMQLLFFILFPSMFTAAFNGVKYIFTQIGSGNRIELTSFVAVLLMLCVYTMIFGRFFCGFACAFGSFGDAMHALYVSCCRKLNKKPVSIPAKAAKKLTYMKYVILTIILILCYLGVYSSLKGTSPWDVFSMLRAGNLGLASYITGAVVLVLIIIGMCVQERFFCRFMCPMGAVFSILPIAATFTLHRDRAGCIKGCDCFQCQKCNGICPKSNIHTGIKQLRGNELWFTGIKAAILIAICIWLGV